MNVAERYFEGIGRRKTSTARVRIYTGSKASVVNDVPAEEYFDARGEYADVISPLAISGKEKEMYFTAHVVGGGITGQREAVRLGIARALIEMDETLKPDLRKKGLVTRDPRMVERKKYNRRKARKKPQFSKR
ncbi:30S ribosomal protein S9 [Candidatus Nomurabacteria bacterium]|uniref:Small ribosomal subunit protein uS9 n=1 Tax=Candidatus Dojkabacteria bacterium TaxID=2099670 RepID=A0A955I128_9BACT|nr:30S ribosomal protein S9 [Candidatus Dojkabacteria bacterium]MCB9789392.1 30S ribosomal protein S9 [Candidatus Nomurabacteria bacterium]MCB9803714.1 30S ribosomal protein S9 [Candidatus Nomurabacteria bacterium]